MASSAAASRRRSRELAGQFNVTAGGIIVPSSASRNRPRSSSAVGGIGASYASGTPVRLPVRSEPLRPIDDSLYLARSLQEMSQWSIEASTAAQTISRDVFQSSDGDIGSWSIDGIRTGQEEEREVPNEETVRVVKELQQRKCGKTYVVGATRFQQAINEMLFFGDSFVQIRLDCMGAQTDLSNWYVAETAYMPTLSTFVLQDDAGREAGYRHVIDAHEFEDYGLLDMLHFCYQPNGLYGTSPFSCRLPTWESLKRLYPAVESAVVDTGAAPWVHTMPDGCSEPQRQAYEDTHSQLSAEGVVKNLYLMPGAEVKKATNNSAGTQELIDTWLEYRRSMIPFGMPEHFFALSPTQRAQEISLQPSMLYARTISAIRAVVGEQIKWICDLEIALKLGIEHQRSHPYDIVWPTWEVQPPQVVTVEKEASSSSSSSSSEAAD